jgi:hypothetical protein
VDAFLGWNKLVGHLGGNERKCISEEINVVEAASYQEEM